jgi:RimJ/RimL family protein N-acetyltransferase
VSVVVRLATEDDRQTIFNWRNDPWLVSLGFSKTEVTWEQHLEWYASVLDPHRHLLYVASADEREIGSVRFDRDHNASALVSIYLLREFTGLGLGVDVLRHGCRGCLAAWPDIDMVRALILPENRRSIRAFEKAGFEPWNLDRTDARIEMRLRRDA